MTCVLEAPDVPLQPDLCECPRCVEERKPASPVESLLEAIAHLAAVPGSIGIHHQQPHRDVVLWARERGIRDVVVGDAGCHVWWKVQLHGAGCIRQLAILDDEQSDEEARALGGAS